MRNGHPVGSRCSRGSYSMYRILSYPAVSYPIVSYRIGSYRIAVEHRVERPHARPPLLFHGKRKRGEDSTEPRRQSATGNLKSCANTEATRELDGSQGDPTAGGSGGGLVSRFPATKQRGSSKYTWKVTLAKLRSSVQFASEWLADDRSKPACMSGVDIFRWYPRGRWRKLLSVSFVFPTMTAPRLMARNWCRLCRTVRENSSNDCFAK